MTLITKDHIESQVKFIWTLLEEVKDPEVPVLSVVDLGVIRNVELYSETEPVITITPTYSGCPAMDVISMDIRLKLLEQGFKNIIIKTVLHPAWTTDWMTDSGKQKLKEYGIAAPQYSSDYKGAEIIPCPQCQSEHTQLLSQFGSTACKALYQCQDCKEPFDYFKCH